ncbi:hypothetical protein OBBRIDRAFT_891875 [Obba rivulosa]|uniref:Uncharacterized protein n=1 Tax=Obba rivulosa TaxID=1052685 RepID=A0A8E2DE06_9APHY|nr:hypothetical protein OBBRIDRAFT_891875 [Obba rivulosa]
MDARLVETRNILSAETGFVAIDAVHNPHIWVAETRVQRLVTQEAFAEAERAHAEYTLLDNASLRAPDPAESADLSIIVRIHPENCFLQADGYWNPTRPHASSFEQTKLRFCGVAPSRPAVLRDDFDAAYSNLEWLMGQVQHPTKKRQGLLSSENGLWRIQFRHAIFEPLTEDNAYTPEELTLPAQYRIEGWPVSTTAARTALNGMHETHRTRPLQAYDMALLSRLRSTR